MKADQWYCNDCEEIHYTGQTCAKEKKHRGTLAPAINENANNDNEFVCKCSGVNFILMRSGTIKCVGCAASFGNWSLDSRSGPQSSGENKEIA